MSALPKTVERVGLELLSGTRLVVQRVPRGVSAAAVASAIAASSGRDVTLVEGATGLLPGVRLLDARGWTPERFAGWDPLRSEVASAESPLIVLVDVLAADSLQQAAPHVFSLAGGARLPLESGVRPARSPAEIDVGEAWVRRLRAEDPTFAGRYAGKTLAIDLLSGRVFLPRVDALALDQAQERMDEGIVYMVRVEG